MNPQNQTTDATFEVLQPNVLESLERAQIDVQISTAQRYPRSLEKFKKRALDMVQQDVETAESCIYQRPVGKGPDGKQKYAEGASIRLAEIVASCFGNIRFGARIIEQTERFVKCEGVCHDLESNVAGKSEAMESTVKRDGTPYDERMRIVVAKACLSKALRDSIFRVVPRALCKAVIDAAQKVIAGQAKPIEARRKAAQAWLLSLKVDDARVFAVLEVNGWAEVGESQLLTLTGLKTAMKDENLPLDEVFPPLTTAAAGAASTAPKMPTATAQPTNVVPMTGEGSQKAAPAPESALKPVETAKTAESVPQPATATAQAPAEPAKELPKCRHCGEEIPNMVDHNCQQMQEAAKPKEQAAETSAATAPGAVNETPMFKLGQLMGEAEVTPEAVLGFCLVNSLAKKGQKLSDLSTAKHNNLIENWATILPEIKKIAAKQ